MIVVQTGDNEFVVCAETYESCQPIKFYRPVTKSIPNATLASVIANGINKSESVRPPELSPKAMTYLLPDVLLSKRSFFSIETRLDRT